jgi:hypothetical protein
VLWTHRERPTIRCVQTSTRYFEANIGMERLGARFER